MEGSEGSEAGHTIASLVAALGMAFAIAASPALAEEAVPEAADADAARLSHKTIIG